MGTVGRHLSDKQKTAIEADLKVTWNTNEVAAKHHSSSITIRTIRAAMIKRGEKVAEPPQEDPEQADPTAAKIVPEPTPAHERKITQLGDEVAELKRKLREAHRAALSDDAMAGLLGILANAPAQPPAWLRRVPAPSDVVRGEVPVLTWADWHLGETVSSDETNGVNAYSMEVGRKRVRRLLDNTLHLCQHHVVGTYEGAVLNLLGDFVSGGLHPELAKTDELEIMPTILAARDLLLWGIRQVADAFGKVYVPCVAGNHGRMTQKPEFKRYAYKNADWVIYKLLQREFEGDDRIVIDVRPANEVDYSVYGLKIKIVHGDMLGVKGGDGIIGAIGPIVRGEIKLRGQSSTIGQDFDLLIMGHWHQQLWLPRVMVSNCLKGFDEYARLALRAVPTPPTQPLFFVNAARGITSRWDVHVEEPRAPSSQWVAWDRSDTVAGQVPGAA